MITKKTITSMLAELDETLLKQELQRSFTVFGSGALMLLDVSSDERLTHDIDIADPEIDIELQLASIDVANKLGLEVDWLNSAGSIYSSKLRTGWRERVVPVFAGKALTVTTLSRSDLLSSKCYAYSLRGLDTDIEDIKGLNPSSKELNEIIIWFNTFENGKELSVRLTALMEELS